MELLPKNELQWKMDWKIWMDDEKKGPLCFYYLYISLHAYFACWCCRSHQICVSNFDCAVSFMCYYIFSQVVISSRLLDHHHHLVAFPAAVSGLASVELYASVCALL